MILRRWYIRASGKVLTIAILVLCTISQQACRVKQQMLSSRQATIRRTGDKKLLTKRENASLNSETCSSVRESACNRALAVRREGGQRAGAVLISQGGVWAREEASAGRTHHVCCGVVVWRTKCRVERKITGRQVQATAGYIKVGVVCVQEVWPCLRLDSEGGARCQIGGVGGVGGALCCWERANYGQER
jgi:hypothetical protein